jgi:hypothetical protein
LVTKEIFTLTPLFLKDLKIRRERKKAMAQQQQQQQQVDTAETGDVELDYLAINRARWDERAPHVSCIPLPT